MSKMIVGVMPKTETYELPREPSAIMLDAAYDAVHGSIGGDWNGTVEIDSTVGKAVWKAMIDAHFTNKPTDS